MNPEKNTGDLSEFQKLMDEIYSQVRDWLEKLLKSNEASTNTDSKNKSEG